MSALADRASEFLSAPVASVMFAIADRGGVGAQQLADPAIACVLAAKALAQLNPWVGDGSPAAAVAAAAEVVTSARVRDLVDEVLHDHRNTWWDAPLDRARQLRLVGQEGDRVDPEDIPVPTGPITPWECYAQKPAQSIITTTELTVEATERIRSGGHAELDFDTGDWNPAYPVAVYRYRIAPDARVLHINSAVDWHAFVARYGDPATHEGSDSNLRNSSGIDNGLAPTWSAVAEDYDGVHLSFAGMLTAVQAPVTSADIGTTTLWAWDFECTHWIRSVFTTVESLAAIVHRYGD